jgi:hypothetical protein
MSKKILYVSKKRQELHMPFRLTPVFFEYSLETGLTTNRTEVNPGYDVTPIFSIWQPNMVADETEGMKPIK